MSAPPDELLSGGDENVLIRPSSLVIETPLLDASNNALIRGKWKGRLVVVKRLGIDVSEEMLQDQAGKWFKLRHPNVSRICGIADHASDPLFTVIPFYNHGNIRQYLTKKLLSNRHKLILDIALGMQYLHNNGIVHGGLRPTNIFVTNDECATISEYGMFELLHTTEDHEAHRYLSPEAWRGINSRSSDIYAFSMCALEIFTSILPWGALSEKHIAHLVMYEDARPTRPDDDEITDDLWSIIVSAWHPEPRSRPSFDLVVRLWRAGTSRVDIPAADESGSNTPTLPPMHRVQSGSSVGSDNSSGSGPPAYDRISVSAPPHIQQFAFNTTENTRSTLQPEDALYSHSRHSSISGHDSSQSSRPRTPNTAPAAVQQFSVNMDTSMFQMRPSSPSYSWYSSAISGDHQPSTSSSSVRSVYPPTIPADSSLSLHKPRIGASLQRAYGAVMTSEDDSSFYEIFQNVGQTLPSLKSRARQDDSSVYEMSQSLGRALPSVESGSRQWEIGQRMPPARHQLSFSEISISSASSGPAGATQGK
ncbi:hypothetical protein GYMLUDRAFT_391998 [Collybiopsis luxurians FD-317 M1]|uniref:Protein kinase domain-containing protein n=1 Tax=Collybiopsis luxurians FD-317 M1 TaxID=944289 RepID=A0A0D0AN12_9AGAR|nr:hypothetical protein GYMLUDRAFT_391998 [Collybiopsis luxurians FD-317 M1]